MGGATGVVAAAAVENEIKSDSKRSPEEACGQRAADDNKHSLSSLRFVGCFLLLRSSLLSASPLSVSPEEE